MKGHDQLTMERTVAEPRDKAIVNSGVKTILLHIQDDASLKTRVQNALSLARTCGAHLSCLHVTPIEAYVAFDSFGGIFVMSDVIDKIVEQEKALRSEVETVLGAEDVSWDYAQVTGNVQSQIVRCGSLADLIVTSRQPHRADFVGPTTGFLGELLDHSRTPLFIPADEGDPTDPTGAALIAWDGSYEAANAVRAAIGLLKLSSDVRVLRVQEEKDEAFPATAVLQYLSRHGIHAEMTVEQPTARATGQEYITGNIIARARDLRAYVVMGGYNHSRFGEYLFGGVTRNLLSASPVPLLIAR